MAKETETERAQRLWRTAVQKAENAIGKIKSRADAVRIKKAIERAEDRAFRILGSKGADGRHGKVSTLGNRAFAAAERAKAIMIDLDAEALDAWRLFCPRFRLCLNWTPDNVIEGQAFDERCDCWVTIARSADPAEAMLETCRRLHGETPLVVQHLEIAERS